MSYYLILYNPIHHYYDNSTCYQMYNEAQGNVKAVILHSLVNGNTNIYEVLSYIYKSVFAWHTNSNKYFSESIVMI